jgi:RNA polymerase sigma factor (TIGR02999 family)
VNEITLLLDAIGRGEERASSDLLPLVYDELRRLAASRMAGQSAGQTLQPTALVHEAWLRLAKDEMRTWQDRSHFFRAAAQAMRQILVDRARRKLSLKCGSGAERVSVDDIDLAGSDVDDRVLLVDEALNQLEKDDPESARVISLKFFGGLTNKEVAAILDVSERSVERQWAYARTRLFEMLRKDV